MLLKHSAVYLGGRLVPAAIGFIALAVYTRLVAPSEFGAFAIVFGSAVLAKDAFFLWISLSLNRYWPQHADNPARLLWAVLTWHVGTLLLTGLGALALYLLWDPESPLKELWPYGFAFLLSLTFAQLSFELLRAQLKPIRYTFAYFVQSLTAFVIAVWLAQEGWGAKGLLLGAIAGQFISPLLFLRETWKGLGGHKPDGTLVREIGRYGLPMAFSSSLSASLNYADRLLIGIILGVSAAGHYAASYDLARQSLLVLMEAINLAAFPLAVRAMEAKGPGAAQEQLRENLTYLLALALPAMTGMCLLAKSISPVFMGLEFREAATVLIPLISIATLLRGLRLYSFDAMFQLGHNTGAQARVTLVAVGLNIVANILLIPRLGIVGAAWAAVLAYGTGAVLSWHFGRKVFAFEPDWNNALKIALATGTMGVVLTLLPLPATTVILLMHMVVGASVYGLAAIALNTLGLRDAMFARRLPA